MNRTKLLTLAVIGLLLINLGTLGMLMMHKPPGPPLSQMPPPHHGAGPQQLIIERLHFDDTQQKQYQLLIDDHRTKTNELHNASREMHTKLYALLKNDSIDKINVNAIIQEIADNQKALDNLNFDHFQKIKNICKAKQIEDFNELAAELSDLFAPKGPPQRP